MVIMSVRVFLTIAVLLAAMLQVHCQLNAAAAAEADSALQQLSERYLPAEYTKANFTLEDAKRMLRKKCEKAAALNGSVDVYAKVEKAAIKLVQCANSIANVSHVMEEIEEAKPHGDLDVVFQKYCDKQPLAEKCLRDFNFALKPCLTRDERLQNDIMMRIVVSLLNFVCYKNGDQIALFIAEEGPECLEANKENISNCMNATFSAYLPRATDNSTAFGAWSELPEIVLGPKQCIDIHDFEECVLHYLEQCNEITPANVIEAMFKYVKNETKCQEEIDKVMAEQKARSGATLSAWANVQTLTLAVFALLSIGFIAGSSS